MILADVSDYNADNEMVKTILKKYHKIDILINNAGISGNIPAEDISLDQWNRIIGVNLNAVFYLSQLVGREMIKQKRGKIVNIASTAGLFAPPLQVAYVATKHAVVGLTKALAVDWCRYNINVNCVCPGFTKTKLSDQARSERPKFFAERINRIPLGRIGMPEEIANGILFLTLPDSDYITGTVLPIDGGNTALFSGYPLRKEGEK